MLRAMIKVARNLSALPLLLFMVSCASAPKQNVPNQDEFFWLNQLEKGSGFTRITAAMQLLQIDQERYIPRVGELLSQETNNLRRIVLIRSLAETDSLDAITYLEPFLDDPSQAKYEVWVSNERIRTEIVSISDEASKAIERIRNSKNNDWSEMN